MDVTHRARIGTLNLVPLDFFIKKPPDKALLKFHFYCGFKLLEITDGAVFGCPERQPNVICPPTDNP
jgi:hypothetical protein